MSNMQQALLLFTENQKVLFSTSSYDRFTLIYKQKQIFRMKWNQRRPPGTDEPSSSSVVNTL